MNGAKHVSLVVEALLSNNARSATKYLDKNYVVRATRPMSKRRKRPLDRVTSRSLTVLVTLGRPNYRERLFVKSCQKAGEPFPVRKIQLRSYPAK